MNRYVWEPGNGTRYDLVYGSVDEHRSMVVWLLKGGSGGTAIMFDSSHYLHHTYLEEKMAINSADAAAVLLFLENMGYEVGMPGWHGESDWNGASRLEEVQTGPEANA